MTEAARDLTPAYDPVAAFIDAMTEAGVPPRDPAAIIPGGDLFRFDVQGDKPGSRNGWAVLYLDGVPVGAFGSWKSGVDETWSARRTSVMTPAERTEQLARQVAAREQRDREQQREYQRAALRARNLWWSTDGARPTHPYLTANRMQPHHARQRGNRLVLPVVNFDREVVSLQFIGPDGSEELLTGGRKRGCFIPVERGQEGGRVLICEGWATGTTLAEAEPTARVMAAIDAGNLEPVAVAARRAWPDAEIVIGRAADSAVKPEIMAAAKAADALVQPPIAPEVGAEINVAGAVAGGGRHE